MGRATTIFLLLLCFSTPAWADTWADRVLELQRREEEVLDFEPDGSNDYIFSVNYPYWLAVAGFRRAMATKGLNAELARFDYTVLVSSWTYWRKDPEAEQPNWLLGVRSRTHLILIRERDTTEVFIREEVQEKTSRTKDWAPQTSPGKRVDKGLKEVVALSTLLLRYNSGDISVSELVEEFKKDPELGTSADYKLSGPDPLPEPNPRDVDRTLRDIDPNKELGYLKHLYWTGRINDEEYEFLEELVPNESRTLHEI